MLDYKDIIVKHFGLGMSGRQIARELGVSKSGVNDVLGAFKRCESLDFPLSEGITNYGIAAKIYGGSPGAVGRDMTYACPDFEEIHKQLHERKNMTLVYLWNRYMKTCEAEGRKGYQYRQFCKQYSRWCETNKESMHICGCWRPPRSARLGICISSRGSTWIRSIRSRRSLSSSVR